MEGDITGTQDIATVYETIFLFLKNQKLFKTAETLEKECEIVIPNASGKVFFRTYQRLGIVGKPTKSFVDKRIVLETFSQTQTDSTNMKKDAKKPCSLNCDLLRSRFCQLQEEYKKLLAVTCELTNALQMNILGQAQNVSCVLEECKNIYPSLFETSTEENKAGFWESPEAKIESRLSRDGESDALEKPEPELIYSNVPQLNLDCFQHDQSTSSSNHLSPHTPLTEREIKNILENILKRVLSILEQNEKGYSTDGTNDCCDSNQTCNDCKNEISKMLDRIVFKVLESPRCRTSRPSPVRRHSASTASCRTKLEMQPINTMAKNNEYLIKVPSEVENKAANDSGNKNDNVYDDLSENQQIKDRAVSLEDVMRSQNKSISHSRNDDLPSTNINSHTCNPTQRFIKNEDVTKNPSNKKISLEQRSPRQQRPSMDSKRLKPPVFRYFSYAKTPMCYMEHCRLLQDGNRNCR
ncbi:unnamed protein product [Acanthoscelides obtectus]|nr:unnamed protein product [Acanthoscelides obtectus]CAK1665212.1 hypothetical protein AOBTE_LOCUS24714 [Acanthoscelides obtectus]